MQGKLAPPAIFTSSFFSGLLDLSVDVLLVAETNGSCRYLNSGAMAVLGYELAEVAGHNAFSWVHPQDQAVLQQALALAQTPTSARIPFPPLRLQTSDNKWCWLSGDIIPMQPADGSPGLAFLLKKVPAPEAALNQADWNQEYYNSLFYFHPDAILTLNPAGIIINGNPQALEFSGYAAEEYFGTHYSQLLPPQDQEQAHAAFKQALQGNTLTLESKLLTQNGSLKDISVTAIPINIGGQTEGIQCIVKDVSRQKQAQWGLENLSLVASKTTNGVLIADHQLRIEWVNAGFTQLTGYPLEEVQGLRASELLQAMGTDKKTVAVIGEKVAQGLPFSSEIQNYNKKGEQRWFLTEVTPVRNEQGQVHKFISIRTDITEKKNRERDLENLTKELCTQNRDLQQFTYIVSHNLRAPIANALGLVNLLSDPKPAEDLYREITKNLKISLHQLDSVIKDINLILSIRDNKDTLALEKVEFQAIFTQVMHHLSLSLQESQGEIRLEAPQGYALQSHKAYLFSILYNLISNAIKYRSPLRPLQIVLKCLPTPEHGTCISCSDNGQGMDLNTAGKNLFKLYKRFHQGIPGRGIGLYLVKTHIETLGGEIEVTSSPDKGTRFLIYLP